MLKTENKLYETPDMKVYQIHPEGVMCGSDDQVTTMSISNFEDGEDL